MGRVGPGLDRPKVNRHIDFLGALPLTPMTYNLGRAWIYLYLSFPIPEMIKQESTDQLCHYYPKVSNSLHSSFPWPLGMKGREPEPPHPQWQGESQVLGEFALTNDFLFLGKKVAVG